MACHPGKTETMRMENGGVLFVGWYGCLAAQEELSKVYVAAKTVNGIGGGNAQSFFKLREIIIFIGNNFGNFLTLCVATTVGGGPKGPPVLIS